jgi:Flp pilus assembly protein TadG
MAAMTRRVRVCRLVRDAGGSEVVEFAFVLPILLLIMAGILDMGFLFNNYQTLTNAAREGARMAAVPGWVEKDVKGRVNLYLQADGMNPAAAVTTVTPVQIEVPGGAMTGVRVVVSYPYNYRVLGPIAKLVEPSASFETVTLTASATMRTEIAAGL